MSDGYGFPTHAKWYFFNIKKALFYHIDCDQAYEAYKMRTGIIWTLQKYQTKSTSEYVQ